jgi:serine acetyltransferase
MSEAAAAQQFIASNLKLERDVLLTALSVAFRDVPAKATIAGNSGRFLQSADKLDSVEHSIS